MFQFGGLGGRAVQSPTSLLQGWEIDSCASELEQFTGLTEIWNDGFDLSIWRTTGSGPVRYRLRFAKMLTVEVIPNDRRILTDEPDEELRRTFEHLIADQVLPRLLAHDGQFVVHAAGIEHSGGTIVLLGDSGSGKSTLAASFNHCGKSLLGDDAMIISDWNARPMVRSVYPSLRLFPDSIEALFSSSVEAQDVAHYSSKQRLNVPLEHQCPGPTVAKAIFVLGEDGPLGVRRISVANACMAIIQNSFALDPTDRQQATSRLDRASRLARKLPAFSVTYPREFSRLPEVREAILAAAAPSRAFRH